MAEGKFNENTRVQVPAALHLVRLGYTYLAGIKNDDFNADTNILTKVFLRSVQRINPELSISEAQTVLTDIIRILGNDDLGREFYGKLSSISGVKLVDFENPANNEWHVTTEFTCEDKESGDNFRPDITCFVNGLPLAFIEVKKPNNAEGILAEKDRISFTSSGLEPALVHGQQRVASCPYGFYPFDRLTLRRLLGLLYHAAGVDVRHGGLYAPVPHLPLYHC